MPVVKFTNALKRFFPALQEMPVSGHSLQDVLNDVEAKYPGLKSYLLDEQGQLRKHVNIFIDGNMINDRGTLSDTFNNNSEIYIIQALSGG
ncbi:MoaD/ThiS family protein [Panacibacter sp. DH6]|uniref:MoaD/ThiS family protein n=1 Tax=Panacibacter microcysteis TaxID=2793269 RepID=A0A931E8A8_9BACT|nr:MoaD/ThiS family protein [Panacibacter microcysteis]MBG9376999.1 MoaD/ThiS family protein [Panacibacter microcysteis]